jgi:hypothetical protein
LSLTDSIAELSPTSSARMSIAPPRLLACSIHRSAFYQFDH